LGPQTDASHFLGNSLISFIDGEDFDDVEKKIIPTIFQISEKNIECFEVSFEGKINACFRHCKFTYFKHFSTTSK
jgi:hypothetical protein